MNSSAVITFLIIASFVWGGVVLIVSTAFRKEGEKTRRAASPGTDSRATPES